MIIPPLSKPVTEKTNKAFPQVRNRVGEETHLAFNKSASGAPRQAVRCSFSAIEVVQKQIACLDIQNRRHLLEVRALKVPPPSAFSDFCNLASREEVVAMKGEDRLRIVAERVR